VLRERRTGLEQGDRLRYRHGAPTGGDREPGPEAIAVDLRWQQPTNQQRDSHANDKDAPEDGACAIAIATAHALGYIVVRRTRQGSGSDYLMVRRGEPENDFRKLETFTVGFRDMAPDGTTVGSVTFSSPTWRAQAKPLDFEPRHRHALTTGLLAQLSLDRRVEVEGPCCGSMIDTLSSRTDTLEDVFRRSRGALVTALTRAFGPARLDLVESVVQEAFLRAVEDWRGAPPHNPAGWLLAVAKNLALDHLRRERMLLAKEGESSGREDTSGMREMSSRLA
jgi:hypothetical protein